MIDSRIISRLQWHAGLFELVESEATSISDYVARGRGVDDALWAAIEDVLDILSELNVQVNGQAPSEMISGKEENFPRVLVYAVMEILRYLESLPKGEAANRGHWLVMTAWSAVLAGDIDDIRQHLRDEELARASW